VPECIRNAAGNVEKSDAVLSGVVLLFVIYMQNSASIEVPLSAVLDINWASCSQSYSSQSCHKISELFGC